MTTAPRRRWWHSPRDLLRQILQLDDTPHSVALGTAIGMFVGLTPTPGIQLLLVVVVAFLARPFFSFNRLAAFVTVTVSNPITTVPLFWLQYRFGRLFVGGGDASYADMERFAQAEGYSGWWSGVRRMIVDFGWPLVVGSLLSALICGLLTYPAMRWLLAQFRRARPESAAESAPATEPTGGSRAERGADAAGSTRSVDAARGTGDVVDDR
jgi:uncharacterized protein (DUF2062 family)